MSKFEDQYDGHDAICPYCRATYQVESEDFSEDIRVDECGKCSKKYHLSQMFSVDHHTSPDCELQGDKHLWLLYDLKDGRKHPFCTECGQCARPGTEVP